MNELIKNLSINERNGEENWNIIKWKLVNEKTFQPELKIEKEKPKVYGERRNLIKKGLGWNKVLFNSQGVETANSQIANGQTANGQTANCQTANGQTANDQTTIAGFLIFFVLGE